MGVLSEVTGRTGVCSAVHTKCPLSRFVAKKRQVGRKERKTSDRVVRGGMANQWVFPNRGGKKGVCGTEREAIATATLKGLAVEAWE